MITVPGPTAGDRLSRIAEICEVSGPTMAKLMQGGAIKTIIRSVCLLQGQRCHVCATFGHILGAFVGGVWTDLLVRSGLGGTGSNDAEDELVWPDESVSAIAEYW